MTGTLREQLDTLVTTAKSPDGQISTRLVGNGELTMEFTRGAYRLYSEPVLTWQLNEVLTTAWTRHRRDWDETIAWRLESTFVPGESELEPEERRYREALRKMRLTGRSSRGAVTVESVALTRWTFTIKEGALRTASEEQFVDEVRSAVAGVLADYAAQRVRLVGDVYRLQLPDWYEQPEAAR